MAYGYDHDYTTDQVRSPLCRHHNAWLAAGGDTAASLRTVAAWLENADMGFTYTAATAALTAQWDRAHPEQKRAATRKWGAANKEHRRAYNAKYWAERSTRHE